MTSRRAVVWAVALWLVFAAVVWNVIFDRMVVLAGRRYSYEAAVLYRTSHRYLLIDDFMRPAVAHAARVASISAAAVAIAALIAIRFAARQDVASGLLRPPASASRTIVQHSRRARRSREPN